MAKNEEAWILHIGDGLKVGWDQVYTTRAAAYAARKRALEAGHPKVRVVRVDRDLAR